MTLTTRYLEGMETIGIAKLRPDLTPTLKRVEAGATIAVLYHEHPRAVLISPKLYEELMAAKAVADGLGQGGP